MWTYELTVFRGKQYQTYISSFITQFCTICYCLPLKTINSYETFIPASLWFRYFSGAKCTKSFYDKFRQLVTSLQLYHRFERNNIQFKAEDIYVTNIETLKQKWHEKYFKYYFQNCIVFFVTPCIMCHFSVLEINRTCLCMEML